MSSSELLSEIKKIGGFSNNELAEILGYNKGQAVYDIARGAKGVSKPAQTAIEYLAQGLLDDKSKKIVPEYIIGQNLEGAEYMIRLYYPRFIGLITGHKIKQAVDSIRVAQNPEWINVVMWLDQPLERLKTQVLQRAVVFTEEYTIDSINRSEPA